MRGPDRKPRKLRGQDIVGGTPEQIFVSRNMSAVLLGVTPAVIDRLIRKGKIVRRKIGQGRQARELCPYAQVVACASDDEEFPTMAPTEELPT